MPYEIQLLYFNVFFQRHEDPLTYSCNQKRRKRCQWNIQNHNSNKSKLTENPMTTKSNKNTNSIQNSGGSPI